MKDLNVHITPSELTNASRIFKQARYIKEAGLAEKVTLLGLWRQGLPINEELSNGISIVRIKLIMHQFNPGGHFWKIIIFLSLIQYRIKLLSFLLKHKPCIVNCHHINLLPISAIASIFCKYKLIYDAHELETEVDGLRGFKKTYLKFSERFFMKYVDKVVVVGDKIAEWYRKEYRIQNVYVVRNLPYLNRKEPQTENLLRKEFSIPDNRLLFIYNGFLTIGRGIELILEAFGKLGVIDHIIFMGYGPKVELVKEYAKLYKNIHYKQAVVPEEIIKYTTGADVGLVVAENTCLSYYYGLSNKLFEYIQSGLPVIVSDFPEMKSVVDNYQCGWKIGPTAENLRICIEGITRNKIREKTSRIKEAQANLCWENERLEYKRVYETF